MTVLWRHGGTFKVARVEGKTNKAKIRSVEEKNNLEKHLKF